MKKLSLTLLLLWSATLVPADLPLYRVMDEVNGSITNVAVATFFNFPSLFPYTPENVLFTLSSLKAKKIFWHSYSSVPAYKDFVDKNCPHGLPQTFQEVPVTSKANYIKQYDVTQTLLQGKMPQKGQIDTSTGTSGKPTKWVRGHHEMQNVKRWIGIASKTALGNKPYIFCNMFALGPWATGMTSSYALTGKQMVLSIGPNLEMLYEALREFGPKHRYVIAGYPPHMKKLVENAPFDVSKYDISIIVGGEAMSENVYDTIIKAGVKAVFSSYGASDLRINIAQQTKFEQQLQRICKENSQFKKELLGTLEGTPIFFHYNPLLDYIEETADGSLLFTDLDQSRVSPRVRYDLGDKGKILKISTITPLLKKYGFQLTPATNLPILCLYGRGEDTVIFNGSNLMYDDLEQALKKIPGLIEKINRYAYNRFENKNFDQQLEFWLELKQGAALTEFADVAAINKQLIAALAQVNQDFKFQVELIQKDPDGRLPMPKTYIFEYGKSPMVEQEPHHKNKYVYTMVRDS
jgi:phenylacetate-CoA ligase